MSAIPNMQWIGEADQGFLRLLDQTLLPQQVAYLDCRDVATLWQAIKSLSVRGAPAIGVAAAYGCVLGAQQGALEKATDYLATSRPTAVNLFWALERMRRVRPATPAALLDEARLIHAEDARMCRLIGEHTLTWMDRSGETRFAPTDRPLGILTHCNAGALATGGIGTATAGMYLAHQQGRRLRVFADETRPLLQGSRLTAFELAAGGIDVTLICDNMAAQVMRQGQVDLVIVGADRIAANGDTANKIGTYGLAVLARHHAIPFLVAAPSSTFDLSCPEGMSIPIEQRPGHEITQGMGKITAPEAIQTYNPAFDVTPAELITAIVTERGVIEPVSARPIQNMLAGLVPRD